MTRTGSTLWKSLESWSSVAFLLGGVAFLASAAITVYDIVVGAELFRLQFGQITVGVGWFCGLVGLLGLYRRLAEHRPWLVRAGAVFVAVGLAGYAIMTVGIVAIVAGVPESNLAALEPVFLPLMLLGSVLTFPLFAFASLLSDRGSRAVGVLLLTPTALFAVNVATPADATIVLVIVAGLAASHLAVGYLLRSGAGPTRREVGAPSGGQRAD